MMSPQKLILVFLWMTTRNLLADDSIFFSKLGKPRYQVKDERIILHGYNNEFLHDYSWYSYKYNRTARVMNMTILSKVNINKGDALVITHTYKRYGNEYKMFPMHYSYDWCQSLEEDVMISFSRESDCGIIACPIKKNVRQTKCKYQWDYTRLPPLMPDGDYRINVNVTYLNQYFFNCEYYATVYRPIQ